MLKKIRITAAVILFALITLLFLDFSGTLKNYIAWIAKIQFLPAVLALNFAVIAALVLVTLLFGRIYCSVICPLGVFQDAVSHIAGKFKKNRFAYSKPRQAVRITVLLIFGALIALGFTSFAGLIAPYSAYGRIATNIFAPVYRLGNDALAAIAAHFESYAFYDVEVYEKSIAALIVAAITFIAVALCAWKKGRVYCNTVCPVGTVLGFLSRFSLFKIRIDHSKCIRCGLCARNCKAECIDFKNGKIDYTRCVDCFDCTLSCHKGAIRYGLPQKEPAAKSGGLSRREFLAISGAFALAAASEAKAQKLDGGLAKIEQKKIPKRQTRITPPGSIGFANVDAHCTACGLCVSACPNHVLRPSHELSHWMQPESSYESGYCRPECTACSEVCPTGAIRKISPAEKSATQIGHAVWIKENCIVNRDKVQCDNCMRHCPAHAIFMRPLNPGDPDSLSVPLIDTARCIGCGACENLCPARPFSAIYVEGHEKHRKV